eukprot:1774634-Rhodomonas_salina.1
MKTASVTAPHETERGRARKRDRQTETETETETETDTDTERERDTDTDTHLEGDEGEEDEDSERHGPARGEQPTPPPASTTIRCLSTPDQYRSTPCQYRTRAPYAISVRYLSTAHHRACVSAIRYLSTAQGACPMVSEYRSTTHGVY